MRRLCLLRHGEAGNPAKTDDRERPLTPSGRRDARAAGSYLAAARLLPDLALVSPAIRTRETWAEVSDAFAADVPVLSEQRVYDGPAEALLEAIRAADSTSRTLLVVGHNPTLQDLAVMLAGRGDGAAALRMARSFPTASLAILAFAEDWDDVDGNTGALERFVTPDQFAKDRAE